MPRKYGANGTIGPAFRFTWSEVACKDKNRTIPNDKVRRNRIVKQARALNKLRKVIAKHYGVKFNKVSINVTSWYRTAAYNKSIGGASKSQHVEARATDITVSVTGTKLHPRKVAELAEGVKEFRNGGIGWYDKNHGSFTHVDHRDGAARWVNG